jgi:hypothetical protein
VRSAPEELDPRGHDAVARGEERDEARTQVGQLEDAIGTRRRSTAARTTELADIPGRQRARERDVSSGHRGPVESEHTAADRCPFEPFRHDEPDVTRARLDP